MFDDNVVARLAYNDHRLATSIQQPLVVCRFGRTQQAALVVVSRSLDKLIVSELPPSLYIINRPLDQQQQQQRIIHTNSREEGFLEESNKPMAVNIIATNDVIYSIAVQQFKHITISLQNDELDLSRDLLLVGCTSHILVYDTYEQVNLFNINTSTKITAITCSAQFTRQHNLDYNKKNKQASILSGGTQKLFALQVDYLTNNFSSPDGFIINNSGNNNLENLLNIELSSERSVSDEITCLCYGNLGTKLEFLLTGSSERKIRVFFLDTQLDLNIQACKLTLNESAKINCLCLISTLINNNSDNSLDELGHLKNTMNTEQVAASLPSVATETMAARNAFNIQSMQQTNYFAYGLDNGFIGVYRLILTTIGGGGGGVESASQSRLFAERLWRHKSRQPPVSVLMYDSNGDGQDELVIGYKNGRLDARSPFTGQLLAKTRAFNKSDQQLASLTLTPKPLQVDPLNSKQQSSAVDKKEKEQRESQVALVACSTSMSLVAYRPRRCEPHRPLKDFMANRSASTAYNLTDELLNEEDETEDWMSLVGTTREQLGDGGSSSGSTSNTIKYDQDAHLIETRGDNSTPIQSECTQNVDLLQRISALQNEQMQLSARINKLHFDRVQQLSSVELSSITSTSSLAHRWNFEPASSSAGGGKLRLTILISNLIGRLELLEVVDKSCQLINSGHIMLHPTTIDNDTDNQDSRDHTNLAILLLQPPSLSKDDDDEHQLEVKIYCQQESITQAVANQHLMTRTVDQQPRHEAQAFVARVYERSIQVPRYSMFVPDDKMIDLQENDHKDSMLRMAFQLNDNTSHLQILDWMRSTFLCFQFGLLIRDERDSWWAPSSLSASASANLSHQDHQRILQLSSEQQSDNLTQLIHDHQSQGPEHNNNGKQQQHRPFDQPANWSTGRLDENGELELRLCLQNLTTQTNRLQISYSLERILVIGCHDADLFVDLIQSLMIEYLKLDIKSHSYSSKQDNCPKLELISEELSNINDQMQQLKETERRIQTEFYESADMTKNLMQQFVISNQLNEFAISKDLLNEISMMLDGAQNSAQAFHLNCKVREGLSQRANNLKEKVHFLLGS